MQVQEASHAFADAEMLRRKVQSMSHCYIEPVLSTGCLQVYIVVIVILLVSQWQFSYPETFSMLLRAAVV